MKIETKFNTGEIAFFMSKNRVCKDTIENIFINVSKHGHEIVYKLKLDPNGNYHQYQLHKSKEALLKTL